MKAVRKVFHFRTSEDKLPKIAFRSNIWTEGDSGLCEHELKLAALSDLLEVVGGLVRWVAAVTTAAL